MYTRLIQKPTFTPLSTAYLMEYLRAPAEDESLVKKLALRAQEAFSKFTNGNIVSETTYEIHYDTVEYLNKAVIELPHRPVMAIESIVYYDVNNTEVTINSNEYVFIPGDFRLVRSGLWNPVNPRDVASLKIVYRAGRDPGAVDDDILAGIEQYTLFLYENRGDTTTVLPDSIGQLWAPFVIYRL